MRPERKSINLGSLPDWATVDLKVGNGPSKTYTTHKGLVWLAHLHGVASIDSVMIEYDAKARSAVFKSIVTGERGSYSGIGDADPSNVGRMIAPHAIRMAETRAINRALRLYLGLGMCSIEELGGDSAHNTGQAHNTGNVGRSNSAPPQKRTQPTADGPQCPECSGPMWDNRDDDKKAIYRCKDKENCKNSGGYPGAIWRNDPVWGIDPPGSKMREAERMKEDYPRGAPDFAYESEVDAGQGTSGATAHRRHPDDSRGFSARGLVSGVMEDEMSAHDEEIGDLQEEFEMERLRPKEKKSDKPAAHGIPLDELPF